jgi:multicomponent Na+:H+ antiporter subunit D
MLPALPVVIPMLTACVCLLVAQRRGLQQRVAVAGAAALLVVAIVLLGAVRAGGPHVLHMGGWAAPVGITFVADTLGALLVVVAAILHLLVSIFALGDINARQQRYGHFTFQNVLIMGVCGAFLTGDLFNLYVWFEVLLIASFVMLVLGGGRAQMEAGIKYVTLSLLSSALFLAAVGILYGVAGTLNMADLSQRLELANAQQPWLVTAAAVLLVISFGIKAAVVPLHFWLPASYHTPAPAVSAIFAGVLTKVGVYALLRVFTLVVPPSEYIFTLLLVIGAVTMVVGVLGAVAQQETRRILSVHIVSQIGFMVFGLSLLIADDPKVRALATAGAIFYVVQHMLVKTNLFLIAGVIRHLTGHEALKRLGGLVTRAPWLAFPFVLVAFSLAGVPPLSGFWAKLAIIRAGLSAEQYIVTGLSIFVGLLTLLSMLKIWNEVFWKPAPEVQPAVAAPTRGRLATLMVPVFLMAAVSLVIGLAPQLLFSITESAAAELLDKQAYIDAVGRAGVAVTSAAGMAP